jgi:hypothetical protein
VERILGRPDNEVVMERNPRTADPGHPEFGLFGPPNDADQEFSRVFEDFVESITLSDGELAVFLALPEASVSDVKRMFAVPLHHGEPARHA